MANPDRQRLGGPLAGGLLRGLGKPRTPIKGDPTAGPRSCAGMPNALADRVVVDQWLACPVDADRTKETMLNGVPLGCAGRIVSDRDAQTRLVRNLLEPLLPVARPGPVGASRVREDQKFLRSGVQGTARATPPRMDSVGSEGRRIVRRSDDDETVSARHIIDAVGNRYAVGIARKVVHVNVDRRLPPIATLTLEQSYQFPLLGIDADDWLPAFRERRLQSVDVRELLVPIGRRPPSQPLSIDPKSILRPAKHPPSLGVTYPEYAG